MSERPTEAAPDPLAGVRVVELGVWVAGPGAAGILADWGADVVKIEPPGGDPARTFQRTLGGDLPVNPVFELDNRGKRGIALDLSTERGLEVAERLLADADVFVTNLRPAALERLGLGPDGAARPPPAARLRRHHRLRARRPRRRPGRLRHRRVLGPGRRRRVAARPRRAAAVPAGRHGRPLRRHDRRGHDQRRARGPAPPPARAGWCRRRCCARAPTRSASTSTSRSCGAARSPPTSARPWAARPSTTTRPATAGRSGSWGSRATGTGRRWPGRSGGPSG